MLLNEIYRLKHITRYSNIERITNEDVAQHSFFVAANVIELSKKYEFNIGRALLMANVHDWPEIYIDDISHQVKRDFPKIKKAHKDAEIQVIKKFSPLVQAAYLEYEEQESLEAIIVKLADVYQCIQYADFELQLGNKGYMKQVKKDAKKLIKKLEAHIDQYHHYGVINGAL